MPEKMPLIRSMLPALLTLGSLFAACLVGAQENPPQNKPLPVKIVSENGAFHLRRDGKPYLVKGAGGDGSKTALKAIGANSFRTWGADNLDKELDAAQKLGLTVTIGIWLGHADGGFNYNDADAVAAQYEMAKQAILKYRNHPALLMWGIGNEMEDGRGENAAMWEAVNNIAALAKKSDPNHPTMTVIAEIGGDKVKNINRFCPDVDVVGINSYGGGPSLAKRYAEAGGAKPYIVTEFGPAGTWETGKTAYEMPLELTSTAKAERYLATWKAAIEGQKLALGGYAFTWGWKQEATATWFGMLLPDGSRLGAADAMQECWSGKAPAQPCPNINALKLTGPDQVQAGATIEATLDANAPDGGPLKVEWLLSGVTASKSAGETEATPTIYKDALLESDLKHAKVKLPKFGGNYRLFAYVRDTHGGAAVANVPLLVTGGAAMPTPAAKSVKLPLTVYSEGGAAVPFTPSGYMGNTGAIKMNEACAANPHSGKTCLQAQFAAKDGWGGIVWQDPANDWGDKMGGANLTGATQLTFWARGEKGGESVAFLCGVIGSEKPFYDTVKEKLAVAGLTKEWKRYAIDLKGKNLSRVKTGFGWTLAASGEPVTFYLDDIRYE